MPELGLRPARPDDEALLYEVYASTRDDLRHLPLPPEQQAALLGFQARAQEASYRAAYPQLQRLVIEVDGVAVGRLYRSVDAQAQHLVDIALLPVYRGQGIGTRVLLEEMRQAAALRLPLRLQVIATNPAQRLYQRLGFEQVSADPAGVYLHMQRLP